MSKVNFHLPKGTKGVKALGLNEQPKEDIVNASFEVVQVIEKKDKNGKLRVWVPIIINGGKKSYNRLFEGSILAGLDNSPVIEADGKLGIDEDMKVTWLAGQSEPSFK